MNQSNAKIYVIGPLKLQNELLVSFLQKETGIPCISWLKPKPPTIHKENTVKKSLILLDCINTDLNNLWIKPGLNYLSDLPKPFIALFNVLQNKGIEKDALKRNVRGIFYESDPPGSFIKGIKSILRGELWFPRVILGNILFEEIKSNQKYKKSNKSDLTPREREVLVMIASGEANEDIAERLCISPNTVKTHIYNIYSKISVPNRIQAALWAAKNL